MEYRNNGDELDFLVGSVGEGVVGDSDLLDDFDFLRFGYRIVRYHLVQQLAHELTSRVAILRYLVKNTEYNRGINTGAVIRKRHFKPMYLSFVQNWNQMVPYRGPVSVQGLDNLSYIFIQSIQGWLPIRPHNLGGGWLNKSLAYGQILCPIFSEIIGEIFTKVYEEFLKGLIRALQIRGE